MELHNRWGGDLEGAGLRGETTMVVQAMDLGLVVPAALFISLLAWRRSAVGYVLGAAYAVTSIAMASAIVGMLVSASLVEGTLEIVPLASFGVFVALMSWLAVRIYRSSTERRAVIEGSIMVQRPQAAGS